MGALLWIDGGATSLENTTLLCTHHHRLHHEGGFGLVKEADGTRNTAVSHRFASPVPIARLIDYAPRRSG